MKPLTTGINTATVLILLISTFIFISCKKQTVATPSEPISDFLPLKTGKYIIYRTDSTVYTHSGTSTEIHSYEEKQIIDSQFTDNMGRSSYRISTYLRDTLETQPWVSSQIYFITPTDKTVEIIENNRIWEKLSLPINKGFSWKGNHYLLNNMYSDTYNFSNDDEINSWPYTYSNLDTTIILNGQTIPHVLEVNGVHDYINVTISDPNGYGALNFMQEFYAKGIGLVSQELVMWEYQPHANGNPAYKIGFGVKRTMLTHN